ncbi:glycosidase [bacterium DOLZORAL124_64_63]|nr:MAG: glycosidase [bacterium DOLZORAL124_64_63]
MVANSPPQLRRLILIIVLILVAGTASAGEVEKVTIHKDSMGQKLQVAGRDFMVFGMNWGYMPIGENYAYDFWGQPDDFIRSVLDTEMGLLRSMGVNAIRQYVGIPARWIQYIHDRYGIYTILNHPVARWGATIEGNWVPNTDYSDPKLRAQVKNEVFAMVEEYRDTPGILMWLLGNENNYGLSWSSFEIEALPAGERHTAKARYLYSLMGELIDGIHARDNRRPVSMANGDLGYIDLIVELCPNLDIFGTNQYRGLSVRDMNDVVKAKLGIPLVYTEFGSDAFNAREMREDQAMQARYLIAQWKEIYARSYGKGGVGNAIGGMIFQWSDGWWKFRQEERLSIHDTNASWPNRAYPDDFVEGGNNMNEEWWGICAKGFPDSEGRYTLYPRAAYFALADAFKLDPYAPTTDRAAINRHFNSIIPGYASLEALGAAGALKADNQDRVRVSGARLKLETYNTGGTRITTPGRPEDAEGYPSFLGFDRLESFFATVEAKPSDNVIANMEFNILGHVPGNPIDEIFYENRGRARSLISEGEAFTYEGLDRVKLYRGSVSWDDENFELNAFYRTGHLHWGHEGDFFGLYRNAYYGENIDIYNGSAPVGMEITGKKALSGLKLAYGPQLWWGANPAIFLKYQRQVGRFGLTGILQEDIAANRSSIGTSSAAPAAQTRKVSLQATTRYGLLDIEGGALWSGNTKVGESFQLFDDETGDIPVIRTDDITGDDTWGFKGKVSIEKGAVRWYAQSAYMGLVADAGPTEVVTFTGWKLKDSGSGNQKNIISGFTYNKGDWQIGPNFLWQKPVVGPIPAGYGVPRNLLYNPATGTTTDPFAVVDNREMRAFEILFTYDPHPATWFYAWDNNKREGAKFAFNLGFVYKDLPTTRDSKTFYDAGGTIQYAFGAAAPAHTEWEIHSRVTGRLGPRTRLVANIYGGMGEPNGWVFQGDPAGWGVAENQLNHQVNRIIHRYGVDARLVHNQWSLAGMLKLNDWGVYDYNRDWNLTYPLQLMGDLSYTLGTPQWFDEPVTKVGVRMLYRTLDENSNRYLLPDGWREYDSWDEVMEEVRRRGDGTEWEIRTYLQVAI